MPNDIELIIQRDLNRLPILPEERWIPKKPSSRSARTSFVLRAGALAATAALIVALGPALAYVRDEVIGTASASVRPTAPSTTAVPSPTVVSRQSVLAHVRGLTAIVPRAQRFEAKLVSSGDVSATLSMPAPAGSLFWVVAVSGDVNCSFCVFPPSQPLHSALFWFDAHTGNVVAAGEGPAYWPDGFDALPDRSRSAGSRTLVGLVLVATSNVLEFQSAESPDRLRLVADENTAYSWAAGLVGGSVLTMGELRGEFGPRVGVTFDPVARPDGTFRLEALRTGVDTR